MSQYFPTPLSDYKNVKVKTDLTNYATKKDINDITHADTSNFALKTNLSNLKTEVDKLDIDKLVPVPNDLSELSNVVKNDVVKKTVYKTVSSLNKKITADKTKHFLNYIDLSYYRGKQYFDKGSGKQNYLVFLPLRKYFKLNSVAGVVDHVLSWQSKGLSNESIKPPTTSSDNSLTPKLNYYVTKTKIKFT